MRAARLPLVLPGVLLALFISTPAVAQRDPFEVPVQSRRVDVAGSAGYLLSTDWSDLVLLGSVSPFTGALEQMLARDLVVDPGPQLNAAVTYWEGRYGFRVHAAFSHSCLAVGRRCGALSVLDPSAAESVDVNVWMYDIGGAVGLIEHEPGRRVWPYVFFGIGGVTYDLEQGVGPPLGIFVAQEPPVAADRQIIIARADADNLLIAIDELGLETKLAFSFGFGTDFLVPVGAAGVGLRLEVSDHVHESPLDVRIADVSGRGAGEEVRLDFGIVHNLRASAGLVLQFGR